MTHHHTSQEWARIGAQISTQPPNWSAAHLEVMRPKTYLKDSVPGVRDGVARLGSAKLGLESRPYALGPPADPQPIRVGFGKL